MKSKKLISLGIMAAMLTGMVLTGCGQSQQAGETTQGSSEATETTESTSAESTAASGETGELSPRRDLTQLRGSYMELTARDYYTNGDFQQNCG